MFYPKYHASRITCWYKTDVPQTLRPYINYMFESSVDRTSEFKTFDRKYRNVVTKLLPAGWTIHKWSQSHFESSAVLKAPDGRYIYLSYPDIRYDVNGWMTNILIRTMAHEKDWRGGNNRYSDIVNLTEDLQHVA